ncbi:MAG: hypothetical protein K2N05_12165 [Muribaculaceae bacterium]|nr:hypothetical protein [Muribaculaceae bacterium]
MTNKKELKEIRFDATEIILKDNLVRGAILPQKISELTRNVIFDGNTEVEGAVFGNTIQFRGGDVVVKGAVFAQKEFYISSDVKGEIMLMKAVGSAGSVTARAAGCRPMFCSDINGKSVSLHNAYVAGSIYADEINLENCVVIGGVFATQEAVISNSIVGTFNTPRVTLEGTVQLLLPSAFTIEPPITAPGTRLFNLSLADLGSMFKGNKQDEYSGRIPMNLQTDEVKSNLVEDGQQRPLRSFTVIGKVLAADMIDTDRFQNHFLLTAASLGPQLLKTYDMGTAADGSLAKLEPVVIRDFMFDILSGKKEPKEMDATFTLADMAR